MMNTPSINFPFPFFFIICFATLSIFWVKMVQVWASTWKIYYTRFFLSTFIKGTCVCWWCLTSAKKELKEKQKRLFRASWNMSCISDYFIALRPDLLLTDNLSWENENLGIKKQIISFPPTHPTIKDLNKTLVNSKCHKTQFKDFRKFCNTFQLVA